MLAIPGSPAPAVQDILLAFRDQARESRAGDPRGEAHGDGWGLVEASTTAVRYLGRKARDAAADPDYERAVYRSRGAKGFLLAHFRQASKGGLAVPNTHPFISDGFAFAHNGTIHADLEIVGERYEGDTDSERYFRRLLKAIRREAHVPTAIEATVHEISTLSRATSLTFLLTDGETLWGYRGVGQAAVEEYGGRERALSAYALGVASAHGVQFVAQEPTHLGALASWSEVPDRHLLVWRRGQAPQTRALRLASLA